MAETSDITGSPWHEGELKLQRAAGVAEQMDGVGRHVLRDYLIEQHRGFYPRLPFIVVGAVDAQGDAWATLRSGKPGFLHSPDSHALNVSTPRDADDPAERGLEDGEAVALLGIELNTRRRNRLNGVLHRSDADGFAVSVGQSYGNCPQYIQLRGFSFVREPEVRATARPRVTDRLDLQAQRIIRRADTFFVASYADTPRGRQGDISHRGGRGGFVRVGADGVLTIPDFSGNRFFNTLGNLAINPKAGLLFVDFSSGDLLQLSGDAEVLLDSPEIAAFEGAERLWRFKPRRVVHRPDAVPLRWDFMEGGWSPSTLMTGDWTEAARRLPGRA